MATCIITASNDADFNRTFVYQTSMGLPIDMTGGTLEMMLRWNAADTTAVIRFGSDTGEFTIIDPVNGLFNLYVTQAVLEQLTVGTYDQSNIMTNGTAKTKIWSGQFTVQAGATR